MLDDPNLVPLVLVILFVLVVLFLILRAIRSIWKERRIIKSCWGNLESYQKSFLQVGILVFFFIHGFATHPAKDSYLPKVLADMLYEAGKGMFIVGVIALLQEIHEYRKHPNKDNQ
ncbi:MAG: hypothetical protein M1443_00775 [Nitrospirae bacterium]|nr:hypothetical protein [Nitrospirota bacterium]